MIAAPRSPLTSPQEPAQGKTQREHGVGQRQRSLRDTEFPARRQPLRDDVVVRHVGRRCNSSASQQGRADVAALSGASEKLLVERCPEYAGPDVEHRATSVCFASTFSTWPADDPHAMWLVALSGATALPLSRSPANATHPADAPAATAPDSAALRSASSQCLLRRANLRMSGRAARIREVLPIAPKPPGSQDSSLD